MSSPAAWRKSSRSGGSSGQSDCVEVAALSGAVGVRDSKHPSAGHVSISRSEFAALIVKVKRSEFDL